jgi:hypothetical protein
MLKSKSRSRKNRPGKYDWVVIDNWVNLSSALMALTGGPRFSPHRGQGPAAVPGNGARTSIEIATRLTQKKKTALVLRRASRATRRVDLLFWPYPLF